MEKKFEKKIQEKTSKAEIGVPSGALDDEALGAAAGGLRIESGSNRCHFCRKTGIRLTPHELWGGFAVGVCDECRRLHL